MSDRPQERSVRMDQGFTVIAYDVSDDKRRDRLAKLLDAYATRVEESVFEGWLTDGEVEELMTEAKEVIEATVDIVRLYRVCHACVGRTRVLGPAPPPENPVVVVV